MIPVIMTIDDYKRMSGREQRRVDTLLMMDAIPKARCWQIVTGARSRWYWLFKVNAWGEYYLANPEAEHDEQEIAFEVIRVARRDVA